MKQDHAFRICCKREGKMQWVKHWWLHVLCDAIYSYHLNFENFQLPEIQFKVEIHVHSLKQCLLSVNRIWNIVGSLQDGLR